MGNIQKISVVTRSAIAEIMALMENVQVSEILTEPWYSKCKDQHEDTRGWPNCRVIIGLLSVHGRRLVTLANEMEAALEKLDDPKLNPDYRSDLGLVIWRIGDETRLAPNIEKEQLQMRIDRQKVRYLQKAVATLVDLEISLLYPGATYGTRFRVETNWSVMLCYDYPKHIMHMPSVPDAEKEKWKDR